MAVRWRAALALLALLAPPAAAQHWNCDDPASLPQQGMNFCAHRDWQAADAELNRVYRLARTAMRALDADLPPDLQGAEAALRDAQRAWIVFRDKACEAEGYLFRGGTMEPFIVSSCMAGLTRQRIQGLQTLSDMR